MISLRKFLGVLCISSAILTTSDSNTAVPFSQQYIVLGWNDLGMHCMNGEFSSLCILPPYNNMWAQVIKRGNPPQLVNSGVTLDYAFPLNSKSSNKVNFWQYANKLFGVTLANDIGLTGNGMTGQLKWNGTAFEASGIPITPFEDAAPTTERPYQEAQITMRLTSKAAIMDQTNFVTPVSTEIHCDKCHRGTNPYDAILKKHDEENGTHLLTSKPVLCGSCHADAALGTTGKPGIPNLSQAIHGKHGEEVPSIGCYDCHPGQQTQCLRDAMYSAGKTCTDCHGSIRTVASSISSGRRPWLDEPKCATCHPQQPENAGKLYRNSTGHGGLYCEACHNSTHAILPTVVYKDGLQNLRLQGTNKALGDCMVCHTTLPTKAGPHGIIARNQVKHDIWSALQ